MNRRILLAAATALAALAGSGSVLPTAASAAVRQQSPAIEWHPCPVYSDEALDVMFGRNVAAFTALWARTQCGTLSVPLDYAQPFGRQITVAVTRLPATEPARRLGSMALNPGGPGGSGYLEPHFMVLAESGVAAELNRRYDLIGFDPRGVGYSTFVDCPRPEERPPPMGPSAVTEAQARAFYDWMVRANRACANHDRAFLGQLTTSNVARDMDRIRRGLGERRLAFLGVSWGTWLGVVYRNLYPQNVSRMWLDSTAIPEPRLDVFEEERARATAINAKRFAAWIAQRHDRYGFGTTAAQVEAALAELRRDFDAHPRTFTDLPRELFDGFLIAALSGEVSLGWPMIAPLLAELRDATSGGPAPPLVKQFFDRGGKDGEPPADLPAQFNDTMNVAVFCNEDTGPRDFESAWAAYQRRLVAYPITGQASFPVPPCAGWPLPVQRVQLRYGTGSLVMAAHRWESPSPYQWSWQMRARVGGSVLTVDDDVHGSTPILPTDCAPRIAAYFFTGRPDNGYCQGVPVPTGEEEPSRAGFATARENPTVGWAERVRRPATPWSLARW